MKTVILAGGRGTRLAEENQIRPQPMVEAGVPRVLEYLKGDQAGIRILSLEKLAAQKQLAAYRHAGFWQYMDTLRYRQQLEDPWQSGDAPWRTWND